MSPQRRRTAFRLSTPPGVDDFHEAGARPAGGWETDESDERWVSTHCAFCGVQCGMHLRVAGHEVIGVEPRTDTHNKGKLCPKGVAAYQQISHDDRLTHPLVRDGGVLRRATWDEALDRVVDGIRGIQAAGGPDAMATYGGASMVNEKTYLLGKFARVALGTRFTDYNGRMCMVSAGAANYRSFGIDRSANPLSDVAEADVLLVLGANVPETFPVYIRWFWEAMDRGATMICVDPRETTLARVAQLHLPIRPGTDGALLNAMLHVVVRDGMVDEDFVAAHTTGFAEASAAVADWTPERAAEVCGVPAADIERAAQLYGRADKAMVSHARGMEHQVMGARNAMAAINLCLATGNIGRKGAGYGTITGQGNGQGGREHGQKCDQLPGQRHFTDPGAIEHVAGVWGIDPADMPGPGEPIFAQLDRMEAGEIRGLLNICSNPMVSWPDEARTRRILEGLELYVVIDIFLSESALLADVVLPGSAWAESEGVVANSDALVCKINKAVDPPGEAKPDMWILAEIARRLGKGEHFPDQTPREVFDELRRASAGGRADYYGITYERLEAEGPIAWPCPTEDHPGTPRLFEDLRFNTDDGKAHFNAVEVVPPAEEPDGEYPIRLTTGRTVAHYLSGNQTRRIGYLTDQTPSPWVEIHPNTAAEHGIVDGAPVRVTSRRGTTVLPAMVVRTIRQDTVFIPYHWASPVAANQLTKSSFDPISWIPAFKTSAVRIEASEEPAMAVTPPPVFEGGGR
ncbi:MAG TPA: molybdopterin oxidoreductase family protein [Acidimicrobiales bacterium]|nr:molybdopterin oxidoreductase family protein [Acidimicrobiales bacterium]